MLPRTARSHEAALRGASRGAGRCSAAGNPAPCSLHHAMIARGAGRRHGAGATFRIGWRRSATRSRRRCLCQSKNRISWSFHGGIPPRVVPGRLCRGLACAPTVNPPSRLHMYPFIFKVDPVPFCFRERGQRRSPAVRVTPRPVTHCVGRAWRYAPLYASCGCAGGGGTRPHTERLTSCPCPRSPSVFSPQSNCGPLLKAAART